jgi:hypothetical protein
MILTQLRGLGTLNTDNQVLLTIPDGYQSVRVYGLFINKGATSRILTITAAGITVFQGDVTNSPLKAGQQLELNLPFLLEAGETITGYQSAGEDVDFILTAGNLPV